MTAIPLGQGLELTEDKLRVQAGTLSDCENYEVAYHSGYRRIDGFLRHDGRPVTEDLDSYRSQVQAVPNGPAYGMHFFSDRARGLSDLYAFVEAERVEVESRGIASNLLNTPGQRAEIYLGGQQTGIPNAWILEPNASFAGESRDLMEILTTTDASIGFISAYSRIEVENGQNIPAAGAQITDGTWIATVRGVEVISGAEIDGDVRMVIWVEDDTPGFIAAGAQIDVSGTVDKVGNLVSQTGYSENGVIAGSILSVATDLDPAIEKGVVIRATERGWEPIQQTYEATFEQGANEPSNVYLGGLQASPTETPSPLPAITSGTASVVDTGGAAWDLTGTALNDAVQADDGSFTTASIAVEDQETDRIRLTDFGVSIDALDEVTGFAIEVVAEKASGTSQVSFANVTGTTLIGSANRGVGTVVDTKATFTFGGPNDLWGANSPIALKDALGNLIVWVSFKADDNTGLPAVVNVYSIRLIVYLREGSLASRVYLRSGGVDQEARVLYYNVTDGGWDTNDAQGRITLSQLDNAAQVSSTAEIRTAAGGGGSLIARLNSNLAPVRLPSKARMAEKEAKFQFITTNFFAAGRLAAVYGVSGAGPAFTFNNQYLFKIFTGRTEDEPRHIARHADLLALGYDNGDADFSVAGRPDLFDGTLGAFSIGFGQRITGMLPLAGDALGVWTEDSTHMVQGRTSDQVQQRVIAPTTGAIEYTVVDMGIPVFCDFRGLNTLQAVQQYGDFDVGRLSKGIRAWLLPRLQSQDQRPVLAEAVRKKNQYRLHFADGQILTMTWLEDRVPRFTFQRWLVNGANATILTTTSGVDVNAEAVGFCSLNETDFCYRTDYGDTFDGDPITASFTMNPLHVRTPGTNKRANIGHVHGIASGEVTVRAQMGSNYQAPTTQTNNCKMTGAPAFAKFRHKVRGRDFSLKISTEGAPEHTLQVVEFPDLSIRNLER